MNTMPMRPVEVEYSRRRFLQGAGLVAGAVVGGYAVDVWGRPAPAGAAKTPRAGNRKDRTVVFIELAGGNDGLNTVVPYTNPEYRRLRPTLAVDAPIDLDGTVGLHPNLVTLAERYRAGQVAIVEGVGYPDNDLSHFASLANWWTAQPGAPGSTGWLGRYLDATVGYEDPLAAVAIGPGPSPALLGARSFATSISDASGLDPRPPSWLSDPDGLVETWSRFGTRRAGGEGLLDEVRHAVTLTDGARAQLAAALAGAGQYADDALTNRAYNGGGTAEEAFDLAARLVVSERPPKVVYLTNLGDYDTHQGQAQRHPALMADLDAGLARFLATVEAAGRADSVILMTLSEFGRRARENGSGTDHGNGNVHFIIGRKVQGGRYGQPASLTDLDRRGNLPFGVDFRSMYSTAIAGWLDADAEAILGKGFPPQAIFR